MSYGFQILTLRVLPRPAHNGESVSIFHAMLNSMPKSTDSRNNVQENRFLCFLPFNSKVNIFCFFLEEMFQNFQPIQIQLANNFEMTFSEILQLCEQFCESFEKKPSDLNYQFVQYPQSLGMSDID